VVEHRVQGLHRIGYNTTITAKYKTGKTTLLGNLIGSLAGGRPFLGRFDVTMPEGRVGLLNYELDPDDMRDWLREMKVHKAGRVAVLNLRGHRFNLANEYNVEQLIKWFSDMEVEVAVFDPFRRALKGFGSENDNDDVTRFTDLLDEVKQEGGVQDLFMAVHMGRAREDMGEERGRGATALDDWTDQRWVLTKDGEGIRYMYAEGRLPEVREFALDYDEETRGLTAREGMRSTSGGGGSKAKLDAQVQEIVDIVSAKPGQLTGDVEGAMITTTNRGERSAAMRRAEKQDRVHRLKKGVSKYVYPVGGGE
jgi:hypothetical protein